MATSLWREWDLLQEQVIPRLLQSPVRPARAWSIGNPADAVAVTVAFHAAGGEKNKRIRAYAGRENRSGDFGFLHSEMRLVPPAERSAWLHRDQRRWVPKPAIAERVVLDEPAVPVDLVIWRERDGDNRQPQKQACDRLRGGGHLLVVEGPPPTQTDLERVGTDGRLFHKKLNGRGPARSDPEGEPTDTLARLQRQEDLVSEHLGLARSLARRFAHRGEAVEDLEAVASLALVKAAGRYDASRGAPFSAYAASTVLGELKRHFRDRAWALRVPRSLQELYLSIKDVREELGHRLGASPTVAQVAAELEVSEDDVLEAMEAGSSFVSDSLEIRGPGDERTNDVAVVDPSFDRVLDRERLRRALPTLEPRERLVLKRLFFDGCTQDQVAKEIGLSQMQVSRLLARTIRKLRD